MLRKRRVIRPMHHCFRMLTVCLVAGAVLSGQSGEEWRRAVEPRAWKFPEDHGSHPDFKAEWWYFTGNLADAAGAKYGYELTFFRRGFRFSPPNPENPWSVRDIFLAHFTITDGSRGVFREENQISPAGPGLAGARTDAMDVWVLDWSAKMKGNVIDLFARKNGMELQLELVPQKPVVLHGRNGLSKKGAGEGEASYYSSFTDLETKGTVSLAKSGPEMTVTGKSWFDHEFSSNALAKEQVGWDWFGLHLSDGRDLMIYLLRRADGTIEGASSGTLVEPDGRTRHLALSDISVEVLDRWRSPRSGGNYPSRWRVRVATGEIDVVVTPLLAGQELVAAGLPGLIYWEGAVAGEGSSRGRRITTEGYVELTGYAGNLKEIF
jgi:predicted secreted hydrolase